MPEGSARWTPAIDRRYSTGHELPKGDRRFLGLVDVTIPFRSVGSSYGGVRHELERVGMGVSQQIKGLQMFVGYSQSMLLAMERDAVVMFGPGLEYCSMQAPRH